LLLRDKKQIPVATAAVRKSKKKRLQDDALDVFAASRPAFRIGTYLTVLNVEVKRERVEFNPLPEGYLKQTFEV